jgi:hypothetical protein
MVKNNASVTVQRTAKTGQYIVKRSSGDASTHNVKPSAASTISQSKEKHKGALKRLADR